MNDMVELTASEYLYLKKRDLFLELLEVYGVENWTGYSDVVKDFNKSEAAENEKL